MKRGALIFMFFIICSIICRAEKRSCPRVTYGVEWGYIAVFYSGYHYNFFAPEGYRVDPRGYEFRYDSNAEAYVHVGYNLSDDFTLAVYMGVSAFKDYHTTIPVSLRATWFWEEDPMDDRWFCFADAGSGISLKKVPKEIFNGKFGVGYRLSLSRNTKLDIHLSVRSSYTHPDIYYYDDLIEEEWINRNNAYLSAFALGMSLSF